MNVSTGFRWAGVTIFVGLCLGGPGDGRAEPRIGARSEPDPGAQRRAARPRRPKPKQSPAGVRRTLDGLLGRFRHEPSIARVQRAAVRRARVSAGRARQWARRVRRSAWMPSLQVGVGAHQRRDNALDREVGTPDLLRAGAVNQISYEIKLSWDLPRLIFDPNELKVCREAQRIAELREQILSQVTRLYFERRRLQLLVVLRPTSTVRTALRRRLRIAELTAVLNSMTGGLFRRRR